MKQRGAKNKLVAGGADRDESSSSMLEESNGLYFSNGAASEEESHDDDGDGGNEKDHRPASWSCRQRCLWLIVFGLGVWMVAAYLMENSPDSALTIQTKQQFASLGQTSSQVLATSSWYNQTAEAVSKMATTLTEEEASTDTTGSTSETEVVAPEEEEKEQPPPKPLIPTEPLPRGSLRRSCTWAPAAVTEDSNNETTAVSGIPSPSSACLQLLRSMLAGNSKSSCPTTKNRRWLFLGDSSMYLLFHAPSDQDSIRSQPGRGKLYGRLVDHASTTIHAAQTRDCAVAYWRNSSSSQHVVLQCTREEGYGRCNLTALFHARPKTEAQWVKPVPGAEGPLEYGLAHPGCQDCSVCQPEVLHCVASPKTEAGTLLNNASYLDCLESRLRHVHVGGYIPLEYAKSNEVQGHAIVHTQEILSSYLQYRWNRHVSHHRSHEEPTVLSRMFASGRTAVLHSLTGNVLRGNNVAMPGPICVLQLGWRDLMIRDMTLQQYLENVQWLLLEQLDRACEYYIWLSLTAPSKESKHPQPHDTQVPHWNAATQRMLETTEQLASKSVFVDLYDASVTYPHGNKKHLHESWYRQLSDMFLQVMNDGCDDAPVATKPVVEPSGPAPPVKEVPAIAPEPMADAPAPPTPVEEVRPIPAAAPEPGPALADAASANHTTTTTLSNSQPEPQSTTTTASTNSTTSSLLSPPSSASLEVVKTKPTDTTSTVADKSPAKDDLGKASEGASPPATTANEEQSSETGSKTNSNSAPKASEAAKEAEKPKPEVVKTTTTTATSPSGPRTSCKWAPPDGEGKTHHESCIHAFESLRQERRKSVTERFLNACRHRWLFLGDSNMHLLFHANAEGEVPPARGKLERRLVYRANRLIQEALDKCSSNNDDRLLVCSQEDGYDRCNLTGLLQAEPQNLSSWKRPAKGEGPTDYGLGHPGCSDCKICEPQVMLCHRNTRSPSEEALDCLDNALDENVHIGGYLPLEYLRSVEVQTSFYQTTQEVIGAYLRHHWTAKDPIMARLFGGVPSKLLRRPICVLEGGWRDMTIPEITLEQYLQHVEWLLLSVLNKQCDLYIWLGNPSAISADRLKRGSSLEPHTPSNIKRWNAAVQDLFKTNSKLRVKSLFVDLYEPSVDYPHSDKKHLQPEWYTALSDLFLSFMDIDCTRPSKASSDSSSAVTAKPQPPSDVVEAKVATPSDKDTKTGKEQPKEPSIDKMKDANTGKGQGKEAEATTNAPSLSEKAAKSEVEAAIDKTKDANTVKGKEKEKAPTTSASSLPENKAKNEVDAATVTSKGVKTGNGKEKEKAATPSGVSSLPANKPKNEVDAATVEAKEAKTNKGQGKEKAATTSVSSLPENKAKNEVDAATVEAKGVKTNKGQGKETAATMTSSASEKQSKNEVDASIDKKKEMKQRDDKGKEPTAPKASSLSEKKTENDSGGTAAKPTRPASSIKSNATNPSDVAAKSSSKREFTKTQVKPAEERLKEAAKETGKKEEADEDKATSLTASTSKGPSKGGELPAKTNDALPPPPFSSCTWSPNDQDNSARRCRKAFVRRYSDVLKNNKKSCAAANSRWLFLGDSTMANFFHRTPLKRNLISGAHERVREYNLESSKIDTACPRLDCRTKPAVSKMDPKKPQHFCELDAVLRVTEKKDVWKPPAVGEGPVGYGRDHPYCTDCENCEAVVLECEPVSTTSKALAPGKKCPQLFNFSLGGYLPVEYKRDVTVQSSKFSTTQEHVAEYLRQHWNKADMRKVGMERKPICVVSGGVYDLKIRNLTNVQFLKNVEHWLHDQLHPECDFFIWIGMTAPPPKSWSGAAAKIQAWNRGVQKVLGTQSTLRTKSLFINVYNASMAQDRRAPQNNLHMGLMEWYRPLSAVFLSMIQAVGEEISECTSAKAKKTTTART